MTSSEHPSEHLRRVRSEALDEAQAADVRVDANWLTVTLKDGRILSTPLSWFPRLVHATPAERDRWELRGEGDAIWWDDIDDGVEIAHLLVGWPSGEGERSLNRWLDERAAQGKKATSA